jgi:hypothetical protein
MWNPRSLGLGSKIQVSPALQIKFISSTNKIPSLPSLLSFKEVTALEIISVIPYLLQVINISLLFQLLVVIFCFAFT